MKTLERMRDVLEAHLKECNRLGHEPDVVSITVESDIGDGMTVETKHSNGVHHRLMRHELTAHGHRQTFEWRSA
jgi:hypothetical protein